MDTGLTRGTFPIQALEGVKSVDGVDVEIYQVPETMPEAVLQAMHAPPKADHPVLTHDLLDKVCSRLTPGLLTHGLSTPNCLV